MKIAIIGCGFVGSIMVEEFLRLAFADHLQVELFLIDDDLVEERNAANQQFWRAEREMPKAEALVGRCRMMEVPASYRVARIQLEDRPDEGTWGDVDLIVSAVDNLQSRQDLWTIGHVCDIPVLHVGLSQAGEGRVEWSFGDHDTFHLSPVQLSGKPAPKDPASGVKPPCELVAMRLNGLMVGLAAARSLAIFCGFDPMQVLGKDCHRTMTTWLTSPEGIRELEGLRAVAPREEVARV